MPLFLNGIEIWGAACLSMQLSWWYWRFFKRAFSFGYTNNLYIMQWMRLLEIGTASYEKLLQRIPTRTVSPRETEIFARSRAYFYFTCSQKGSFKRIFLIDVSFNLSYCNWLANTTILCKATRMLWLYLMWIKTLIIIIIIIIIIIDIVLTHPRT